MITATYDPAQWQLAPKEPTQDMVKAAITAGSSGSKYEYYCAMLAAAPTAPAQPRNFCPDCGKRTPPDSVHTCTPPAQGQPAQERLTDEQYQEILRAGMTKNGIRVYLNGEKIEIAPHDFRAIIDRARVNPNAGEAVHLLNEAHEAFAAIANDHKDGVEIARLVRKKLDSLMPAMLASQPAAPAASVGQMICQTCGADRLKERCKGNYGQSCRMVGEAYAASIAVQDDAAHCLAHYGDSLTQEQMARLVRNRTAAKADENQLVGTETNDLNSGQVYGIIDPDYGRIYTIIRKLAWEEGYAIGLHGSFTRDLDLIAVPWDAVRHDPEHLVRRIIASTAGVHEAHGNPGLKPHGRKVWTLFLEGIGDPRFVDLSIMPVATQPNAPSVEAAPVQALTDEDRDAFHAWFATYDPKHRSTQEIMWDSYAQGIATERGTA